MTELLAPSTTPASDIAFAIAHALLEGFNKHYRLFRQISREAKGRFERAQWHAVRQAHAERIQFYGDRVRETVERLQRDFDTAALPDALWQEIKLQSTARPSSTATSCITSSTRRTTSSSRPASGGW